MCLIVSSSLDLLLHEDFLHSSSLSKSSTRPYSTTEPNKSTEHSANRKAVSTVLWLQVTLIACYLPYSLLITLVIHAEPFSSVSLAWSYTLTLLYLNSSLNPILYCWKLDEVRQAVKDTIRQVLCC